MSRRKERERAVKGKLAELRKLRERRDEVDKSIKDLKEVYGDLTEKMVEIKSEIRVLGARVRPGEDHAARSILWRIRDGRRLSDERP